MNIKNLDHILHRYGDTVALPSSYPPQSHKSPSLGTTRFEFWDEPDICKNYI